MLKTIVSFLTNEECEEFISLIESNNQRSSITGEQKYIRIINNSRTSNTSFLSNKNNLVSLVKQRIVQQIDIDINNIETLQGVKYEVGQYFGPHCDAYYGIRKETLTKESGNRVWTFLIYLNDDFEGGETNFPKLNYEIKPKKGMALFWKNIKEDGEIIDESQHEGKQVLSGIKYILTTCIREREFNDPAIIGDNVNSNLNLTYLKSDD